MLALDSFAVAQVCRLHQVHKLVIPSPHRYCCYQNPCSDPYMCPMKAWAVKLLAASAVYTAHGEAWLPLLAVQRYTISIQHTHNVPSQSVQVTRTVCADFLQRVPHSIQTVSEEIHGSRATAKVNEQARMHCNIGLLKFEVPLSLWWLVLRSCDFAIEVRCNRSHKGQAGVHTGELLVFAGLVGILHCML